MREPAKFRGDIYKETDMKTGIRCVLPAHQLMPVFCYDRYGAAIRDSSGDGR